MIPIYYILYIMFAFFFILCFLGLGRELCHRLFDLGAIVYAISLEIEALKDLQKSCPTIKIIAFDLRDWKTTRQELSKFLDGVQVDGLVNNAGVTIVKPFLEFTEAEYDL